MQILQICYNVEDFIENSDNILQNLHLLVFFFFTEKALVIFH